MNEIDVNELDKSIAANVREFELNEIRRQRYSLEEREKILTEFLGPETNLLKDEAFSVGDEAAGVTSKSVWFQYRRIYFPVIINIAVGELAEEGGFKYCVDVNCTLRRSYRIVLPTIPDTDKFLVALSKFMELTIVPTVEEELREKNRAAQLAAMTEADADRRQRRMELLAIQQRDLLDTLIQVECAPRVSFLI
jgi:hypothetical protein